MGEDPVLQPVALEPDTKADVRFRGVTLSKSAINILNQMDTCFVMLDRPEDLVLGTPLPDELGKFEAGDDYGHHVEEYGNHYEEGDMYQEIKSRESADDYLPENDDGEDG